MGEVLDGDRMAVSLYDIAFNVSVKQKELCTQVLSEKQLERFKEAIEDLYYFEFVFGELINYNRFSHEIANVLHVYYIHV